MNKETYVIGVDYGSDSVRSIVVNAKTGKTLGSAVHPYARWKQGDYCDAGSNRFRQHPLDYIEGLENTVKGALAEAGTGIADKVVGLSIDTTGSTPVAVNKEGTPLALTDAFKDNPNAMFVLWKDHTAIAEAEEINTVARSWGGTDYTMYSGGIYSSEWFFSKILHILREDRAVRDAAYSWVEHCDWLPALITGDTNPKTLKRSRCAAGHKAMWHASFDGLPSDEFLTKVDPILGGLRERLYTETYTSDVKVGTLTQEWAERLGLTTNVAVGVGAFDAHMGAVGGEISAYTLSKVMGTSTCDMLVAPMADVGDKLVKGICGQVDGSIIPGMLGMEAGQSAFGDIYAWFKNVLSFPLSFLKSAGVAENVIEDVSSRIIPALTEKAEVLSVEESKTIAVDWMNGRRTPDANQLLKGGFTNLTLGTDAPRMYKALVEATAFGGKKIIDRFKKEGVHIDKVIALGGIPKKSPYVMQVCADVFGMPIEVAASEQACALGAAMFAATVAGVYTKVEDAQRAMGAGFEREFTPNTLNAQAYAKHFEMYSSFGTFIESEITKPTAPCCCCG